MSVSDWLSEPVRASASDRKLQAGQTLFRAGQKTVGLYEVVDGKVRLVRVDRNGREAILQLASAGDTLAEASLFSSTYHCDAVATTEAAVQLYPKAILLIALKRDPEILRAFTAMLAQQVMTLRTRLERRNIHSARDRVRHFLAISAEKNGRTVSLPGTLDIKRLFAYSSIEHMGIITFAFGMGGPLANFAGLLHMTMHSLTKSAIFFAVGHVTQVKGTQRIADMGGLTETHPLLGWGLILGVVAIAGLPPLGIFMSEFLVVSSTFARAPLLAIVLVFGLLVALGGLFLRLNSIAFGEPHGPADKAHASYVPMFAHLTLVFVAGVYMPPALVAWFHNVAGLLG